MLEWQYNCQQHFFLILLCYVLVILCVVVGKDQKFKNMHGEKLV